MNLKIKLVIVFSFLCSVYGFSQDSTKTKKVLYKIPAAEVKQLAGSSDSKILPLPREIKSIYSCEINNSDKKAVVTARSADGTVSKETFEIIEKKK